MTIPFRYAARHKGIEHPLWSPSVQKIVLEYYLQISFFSIFYDVAFARVLDDSRTLDRTKKIETLK
jgi:hypothetical protein